jgi:hypothetical protein
MLGLERLQPVHQHVVLRIGKLGSIERVVQVLMVANLVAQSVDLLMRREPGHHSEIIESHTSRVSRVASRYAEKAWNL